MLREQCPIEPTRFIVLAIGVVISALRAPDFVPHDDHRNTERQHRRGKKILHLPIAQLLDRGIIGRALDPAIPSAVVAGAVAIAFTIQCVVFFVIRNQIVQRKAIMAGDKVDALLRLALLGSVDIGTTEHAVGKASYRAFIAAEKAVHIVPEFAVPFLPGVADKAAYLVQTSRIPGL